jgi:nucleoside-diphosphate-sugar epimerase
LNTLTGDLEYVVARTAALWGELRGARLLLTGGTGFFGAWLLESFCWANRELALDAEVFVLTRDGAAFARRTPHLAGDSAVRIVEGDVRTVGAEQFQRQGWRPQQPVGLVIHAATDANAALLAERPLEMLDTIVLGTRNTLELARALGARRLLLASSGAVYGQQPANVPLLQEGFAGGPDCATAGAAYAEGKRVAETMCASFARTHGLETVIARCFAFVGPYLPLDSHFAVGNFIRDAMRGGPIAIAGDGSAVRSYLYAADLAIWLWTILLRGVPGRPYNVGSERALTVAELASAVSRALGGTAAVTVARGPVPGALPHRYVPSVSRATSELGLTEGVPLELAIRKTANWNLRAMPAS